MLQNILDEVIDGEPRYNIFENSDKTKTIELANDIIEEGTPINRALFRNFQGDLYTQDRYNVLNDIEADVPEAKRNDDIIPKTWNVISATECRSNDGCILTASSAAVSSTTIVGAVGASDRNENTYWITADRILNPWLKIKFPKKQNITKMRLNLSTNDTAYDAYIKNIKIQGSNDNENWDDLYQTNTAIRDISEITLNNSGFYAYYRIFYTFTSANYSLAMVREWSVTEYTNSYEYVHKCPMPLTSYEKGKIINIICGRHKDYEANYTETSFSSRIQPTFASNDPITNEYGTWEISGSTGWTSGDYVWQAFDNSTSTQYDAIGTDPSELAYIQIGSREVAGERMWAIKPISFYVGAIYDVGTVRLLGYNISTKKWDILKEWGTSVITSNSGIPTAQRTFSISTSNYYSKFKLEMTGYESGDNPRVDEFYIISGTIRSGTPADIYAESFTNSYININNLGAKMINGTIRYGEKYSLYYNGSSWDILNDNIVSGTYTGNSNVKGRSQEIKLGFRPKFLIVAYDGYGSTITWFTTENMDFGSNYTSSPSYYPTAGYCKITNDGFAAYNGEEYASRYYGYNFLGETYKYIAIK